MLISLKCLQQFVDYQGTAEELGAKLTMLGLELEGILHPYENIQDIVVGKVLSREKHPEADKLSVCSVDVGTGETLTIVCGAPNVVAGQTVPVATIGTTMPDGMKIKKAKLRGQESCGMICSERELGLSDEHNGIMVLDDKIKAGSKIIEALGLHSEVLEFGITPNRADCLSFIGIAREVALAYNLPEVKIKPIQDLILTNQAPVKITIAAPEACPYYSGLVVEDVNIQPSPSYLRYLLHAHGLRSISNVVDITNYILLAYGQPLHAFDLDLLASNEIIVRFAKENEEIVTLDGHSRKLLTSDLLICDQDKAVALAGVMGGQNTEINEHTKRVFIECAVFNAVNIRKTSRRLGLTSDSSFRYERGIDELACQAILPKAANLMAELSGGRVNSGLCLSQAQVWTANTIPLRHARAEALLGVSLDSQNSLHVLTKLGCQVDVSDAQKWFVQNPSYRKDLQREVDLIEELARAYGMDKIPETLPNLTPILERFSNQESEYAYFSRIRSWASGLGLNETINYSFIAHQDLDKLGQSAIGRVEIVNPLSEEQKVMRTILAPSLLRNIRQNAAQSSVRIFELAKSFHQDPSQETKVLEKSKLALLVYGQRSDQAYPKSNEQDLADYREIKALLEHLVKHLHLDLSKLDFILNSECDFAHFLTPCVEVYYDKQSFAYLGQVKTDIADFYNARKEVWYAELDMDLLKIIEKNAQVKYQPLAIYPAIKRDITVIASSSMQVQTVLQAIKSQKIANFENAQLIDIYEPENKTSKNLTFRLSFRNAERTLQDSEVDKEREKICANLINSLDVKI